MLAPEPRGAWAEHLTWGEPQEKRRAWVHAGSDSEDSLATEDAAETHDALPPTEDGDGAPSSSLMGTPSREEDHGVAGQVGPHGQELEVVAAIGLGDATGNHDAT